MNFDGALASAADASSGGIEESGEVCDFGFACSIADDGGAFGQRGGDEDIAGTGDGGSGRSGQIDGGADQLRAVGGDAAFADADVGSE
ncbi:MAG TPA: hypothetical protein DCR20_14565, partial [Planctomycetaceae bacterium]|nr:hypothetical protein [Planctomycetaceae bacterium]